MKNTISNKLSKYQVVTVVPHKTKKTVIFYNALDDFYRVPLNKKEMLQLIKELSNLVDKME